MRIYKIQTIAQKALFHHAYKDTLKFTTVFGQKVEFNKVSPNRQFYYNASASNDANGLWLGLSRSYGGIFLDEFEMKRLEKERIKELEQRIEETQDEAEKTKYRVMLNNTYIRQDTQGAKFFTYNSPIQHNFQWGKRGGVQEISSEIRCEGNQILFISLKPEKKAEVIIKSMLQEDEEVISYFLKKTEDFFYHMIVWAGLTFDNKNAKR